MFKIIISLSIFFLSNDLSISEISFKVIKKGSSDRRFIWLHGDEQTARMALDDHMSNGQGIAYYIKNDKTREVLVSGGLIDANRIFSSIVGILNNRGAIFGYVMVFIMAFTGSMCNLLFQFVIK